MAVGMEERSIGMGLEVLHGWEWATQNANLAITGKLPTLFASAFSPLRGDNTVSLKMVLEFIEEM